jgi:hypothetical protein
MKKFGFLYVLVAAVLMSGTNSAFAGGLSVKIDSFTLIDQTLRLGELCGTVTVTPEVRTKIGDYIAVTVTADPKTGNPGLYNTLASQQGTFCTIILTYTGTATATAWVPASSLTATSDVAQIGKRR